MVQYLLKRVVQSVIVLLLVTLITFVLVNLAPGGPTALMSMDATQAERDALAKRLGLDRPIAVRYAEWIGKLATGDFGLSLATSQPVTRRITERLPNTMILTGSALVISVLVGVLLGVTSAVRRNSWVDYSASLVSIVGLSIPAFWFGIMLIMLFSVTLHWLPSSGVTTSGAEFDIGDMALHMAMPLLVMMTTSLPSIVRFTRSSMVGVISQDYIRTAHAKGLAERKVLYKHALRNALIPVVSMVGIMVPRLVGGAVVTEAIFGWPGMGQLVVEAANGRDYPLVMGVTVVVTLTVLLTNIVVDLIYAWTDPRIHTAHQGV